MKSKNLWFVIVVAVQALILLGIAGTSYAGDRLGREIRLETVPVDPRDVLYGDYVTLSYPMSRLDRSLWKGERLPQDGDVIRVVLAPQGEIYAPVAAYPGSVQPGPEEVVLKGIVQYGWDEEINVKYGLERYYVPEGTGMEWERVSGDLLVTVKVAPWGQPMLKEIHVKK